MDKKASYRYLNLISILTVMFLLLGLVLQNRLVSLGNGYVSATIFTYPIVCFLLDIIAEIYGYQIARQILWIGILAAYIFGGVITIVTDIPAPSFWTFYSSDFNVAMNPIFRVLLVGTASVMIGQFCNIYILTKLRIHMKGRFFALRSIGATVVGDTITVVISLIGFFIYKMTMKEIAMVIANELFIMYAYAILLAIPGNILANLLRKREGAILDDKTVNYNPFSVRVD